MEEGFVPLATYSGHPHLSNEQRQEFYDIKKKNLEVCSPLLNGDVYKKLFGHYDDFQRWRVSDLKYPCIHPIHLLYESIMQRLDKLVEKEGELQARKEMGTIEEDEYNNQRGLLNFYYIEVISNLDLSVKRVYKDLIKQKNNDNIVYKDVEFSKERFEHPTLKV